jgi:predicted ATPase/class 3 adenylate cyclase
MPDLSAYLPQDRLQALARGENLPDRATGAALFADISGFTPLTATLAKEMGRKRGAEKVMNYINPVYEALIGELHSFGGSAICFSGDAITCWFDDAPRALACAMAMQVAMRQFATVLTLAGTPVTMSVKVAVAAGPVRRFLVGNPAIHTLETLAGSTLERMAAAEHNSQKGEVVVDEQTFEQLNAGELNPLKVLEWRVDEFDGRRFAVLGELPSAVERSPWPQLPPGTFSDAQVRPWILPGVFARLQAGGEFVGDLRPVSSLFIKFGGIDYDNDPLAGEKLDAYINWVQSVVHRYDGALLQLTIGDKGSNMYICLGAPTSHEDDPYRILDVALALHRQPQAFDYIGKVQIGVTRGEVWTGACGADSRHYFGVLGNEVNMAARLMVRASPGQTLTSQEVAEITADRFQFQALGEVQVKGRAEPLDIAEITGEIIRPIKTPKETALFGRQDELRQLEAALDAAQSGGFRVICLQGEAGMGKSRLLAAFEALARGRGLEVFSGLGQGVTQHSPYSAWRGLLEALLGLESAKTPEEKQKKLRARAAELTTGQAQPLERRLPLLNDILHLGLPENELTAYLSPELRQQSLAALVLALLRGWAERQPLLLALDDAQWLDALSRELLAQMARGLQASGHPLLLLLASRPQDDLPAAWPEAQVISLAPLSPQDIQNLVASRLGVDAGSLSAELASLVVSQSQGNPFFAQELAISLREAGSLGADGSLRGPLALSGDKFSDSLQGVILARIDRLPAEQQAALKMAAVIGRSFAYPALHYTLQGGSPDETLLARLDGLAGQDFIAMQPNLSYIFKHIITQEVAYETLLFDQRKRIHRRVAEWYETTFTGPGALSAYLPLLTYHYHHAEDAEKERMYARLAGEQAALQGDQSTAVDFYTTALTLTPVSEPDARFELLLLREQSLDMLGARSRQAEDLSALEELADTPHKRSIAALRRASYAESTSDYPAAIAAAQQALAALQSEDTASAGTAELLARAETAWGEALRLQGDFANAQTHLERAVACLRPIKAERALSSALRKLGVVARNRGDSALAADCYAEALSLSRAAFDPDGEAAVLNNLGAAALKQADYAHALEHFQSALKLYQELGDRRREAGVLSNLALVSQALRQADSAQNYRQKALLLYREIGDRRGEATALSGLGSAALAQGKTDEAGSYHRQALAILREVGDQAGAASALNNLGLVSVAQKDSLQAQSWFDQALALYRQTGNRLGEADALRNLGSLSASLGETARARETYQQALEIYRAIGNPPREAALLKLLEGLGKTE